MRAPDFIIVGAQKCGTTSLFQNFDAHSSVGMHTYRHPGTSNETDYFTVMYKQEGIDWYMSGFPADAAVVGEKSPNYHINPSAMRRIAECFPKTKIIFLVRDPIKRLLSQINMRKASNPHLDLSVQALLEDEKLEREYLYRGRYGDHINSFPERFKGDQLLVLDVDEEYTKVKAAIDVEKVKGAHGSAARVSGASSVYESVCEFIGVTPEIISGPNAYYLRERAVPEFSLEEIARLSDYYRESNDALSTHLGRRLNWG